jgi:hypothetical protein
MTPQERFSLKMSRASGDVFASVLKQLYSHVEAEAFGDVDPNLRTDPYDIIDEINTLLDKDQHSFDRGGIRKVVSDLFADMLEGIPDDNALKLQVSVFIRDLKRTLTGNIAFDGSSYTYGFVGPFGDDEQYLKQSPRMRANEFRHAHHLSSGVVSGIGDLTKMRGIVFEAPLVASEIMIAGAAQERGMEMVLINYSEEKLLPGVPTFKTSEEAFSDLLSRCRDIENPLEGLGDEEIRTAGVPGRDLPADALKLRIEILEQGYKSLMGSMTFSSDRHAAREAELFHMIHEDRVPEDVRKSYFDIIANGSMSGISPVHAHKINGMRHRIEALEKEVADLQPDEEPEM